MWSLTGLNFFTGWEKVTVIGPYQWPKIIKEKLNYTNFRDISSVSPSSSLIFLFRAFQTSSTYLSLLHSLPTMHLCSKKSFIGICGKMKKIWLFARSLSFLTHFFPFSCVLFITIYVTPPTHFFLCFQSHLRHWGQQAELWFPFCVPEAGLVATLAALLLAYKCIVLQALLVIRIATGAFRVGSGFLLPDLFLFYFGQ